MQITVIDLYTGEVFIFEAKDNMEVEEVEYFLKKELKHENFLWQVFGGTIYIQGDVNIKSNVQRII